MGDFFETIVDVQASAAEAEALAAEITGWLVDDGIIAAETDAGCVLGAGPGHPPGPRYATAVSQPDVDLSAMVTNGFEIRVGAELFDPGQDGFEAVTCPRCDADVDLTDGWASFMDAFSAWSDGGSGGVPCPECAAVVEFNDWLWPEGSTFAIGRIGLTFWNWPPLSPSFVGEVSRRLGHRVVVTGGKF